MKDHTTKASVRDGTEDHARQACLDLHERALLGGAFYLVAWLLVAGFGGAFGAHPVLSTLLAAAFAAGAIARFPMHRRVRDGGVRPRQRSAWLWALLLTTSALWAAVSVWALLDPHFAGTDLPNLVATVALGTAFAQVYSIDLTRGALGTAAIYLPPLAVVWTLDGLLPVAVAMSVHLVYLFAVLVRSHREYWRRLDLDEALRIERDRYVELARTDPLTGLANRRRFAEILEHEFKLAESGSPLALAIIDLDHFKRINDQLGHVGGDACLREVALRLRDGFAAASVVARLGGEEFGVLLPGEDAAAAEALAEAFRAGLEARPIEFGGARLPATASIGVADAADVPRSEDLFRAADRALYRAKDEGRNRVVRGRPG